MGERSNFPRHRSQQGGLTPKQAEVLAIIQRALSHIGRPPSLREIATELGVKAVGTIQDHVRALKEKGYLEGGPRDATRNRAFHNLRPSHHGISFQVPILGTVPAGNPIEAIPEASGSVSVSLSGASQKTKPEQYYALRVKGDSMIDAGIFEGDVVIVHQQDDANDGDIVVAMIDGEATVKYLEKKFKGGSRSLRLIPANHRYAPIDLMKSDEAGRSVSIAGKVVSLQRSF